MQLVSHLPYGSYGVHLDFFHATEFRGSEHSEEKVYEVYILFKLSWSALYPSELELQVISGLLQVSLILLIPNSKADCASIC